jgi:chromosome segregation ATPase
MFLNSRYNIIVNELRELKKEVRNEDDLSMRWNNEKKELEQDLRILREKNSNLDRERANLDSKVTNLKSQNEEVEKMADTYQKNSEENLNGKVAIQRKFEELTHQYSVSLFFQFSGLIGIRCSKGKSKM